MLPREDGQVELDGLFVEPAHWRRGIERLLVLHCAEASRSWGASALHVVGNPHASSFYLSCGFEVTGSAQTRFGEGLLMRRPV